MNPVEYSELFKSKNYKDFLNILFIITKKKNPRLSKRSFAKKIGISHSHLINTLASKKKLTTTMAIKISDKCNFDMSLKIFFTDLVENGPKASYLNSKDTKQNTNSIYANWYNPAILSLAGVRDINLTPEKASQILNIPLNRIEKSFKSLVKESLLKKSKDGFFERTMTISAINKIKNKEIERFHLQLLDLIKEKIISIDATKRAVSSLSFAVSEKQFEIMQEKIFNFTYNLVNEAKENNNQDSADTLFIISAQLIPVCKF